MGTPNKHLSLMSKTTTYNFLEKWDYVYINPRGAKRVQSPNKGRN